MKRAFHYSRLISCCILGAKYGHSKQKFNLELFGLYEIFLGKKYYEDKKTSHIPANLYRAIIFHALKLNKPDRLLKLIYDNGKNLGSHDKDNMQLFAFAYYYYSVNNSGAALTAIGKLKAEQFIFKYDIYNLKLRIYIESGNYEAALELIHSYRQYLRNDPLMQRSRKSFHRAFILYAEKLVKLSLGSARYDAGFLAEKIKSSGTVVHKEWLIKNLSVFEKSQGKFKSTG